MIPYKVSRGTIKAGDVSIMTLSCCNCGFPIGSRWVEEDIITDKVDQYWNYCPYCGISNADYLKKRTKSIYKDVK